MKITAKVVPYSSVVGSSVTLHAESGMTICQLSLLSVIPPNFTFTPELHKQTSTRIAEWVAGALNGAALFFEFDQAFELAHFGVSFCNKGAEAIDFLTDQHALRIEGFADRDRRDGVAAISAGRFIVTLRQHLFVAECLFVAFDALDDVGVLADLIGEGAAQGFEIAFGEL